MTNRLEIYKCEVCGNIVEVLHAGEGELVCCGKPMVRQVENTVDASKEKHVPVIERRDDGVLIKIGAVPHPMEEKHYIEWVQIITDKKTCRHFFKPGDPPEAFFPLRVDKAIAREYCNLHGLWKAE